MKRKLMTLLLTLALSIPVLAQAPPPPLCGHTSGPGFCDESRTIEEGELTGEEVAETPVSFMPDLVSFILSLF